jgi:hypothetical protein
VLKSEYVGYFDVLPTLKPTQLLKDLTTKELEEFLQTKISKNAIRVKQLEI